MATNNEQKWQENYAQLKRYIEEHRHLPDKKKVEFRGLFNWWKYNKKLIKQGELDPDRMMLLQELSEMRAL